VTVDRQVSGQRTYDVNVDGVAHYGLYPDWIEDLRRLAGDEIVEDMARGPEAYLQMWERAVGIEPTGCRTPARLEGLRPGTRADQVLALVGQPERRQGSAFTYCVVDGEGLTTRWVAELDSAGRLTAVASAGSTAPALAPAPAPAAPGRPALPATGRDSRVLLSLGIAAAVVAIALRRWLDAP